MQRCELGPLKWVMEEALQGKGRATKAWSHAGIVSAGQQDRLKSDESTHASYGCPLPGPRSSPLNTALHSLLTRSGLKYLNTSCSVVSRGHF